MSQESYELYDLIDEIETRLEDVRSDIQSNERYDDFDYVKHRLEAIKTLMEEL